MLLCVLLLGIFAINFSIVTNGTFDSTGIPMPTYVFVDSAKATASTGYSMGGSKSYDTDGRCLRNCFFASCNNSKASAGCVSQGAVATMSAIIILCVGSLG